MSSDQQKPEPTDEELACRLANRLSRILSPEIAHQRVVEMAAIRKRDNADLMRWLNTVRKDKT